mmetsp:Transcript_5125/g.11641  ORF Transcript_5125/g.11641 Transcript_5125/m.11641 type:complete len:99 (+) Transcript_5125:502-798(+)
MAPTPPKHSRSILIGLLGYCPHEEKRSGCLCQASIVSPLGFSLTPLIYETCGQQAKHSDLLFHVVLPGSLTLPVEGGVPLSNAALRSIQPGNYSFSFV